MVQIRPITDDDLPALGALLARRKAEELLLGGPGDPLGARVVESQADIQRRAYMAEHPGSDYHLIEDESGPVGALFLHEGPDEFMIVDILVRSDCQRRGIGESVLLAALGRARDAGKPVRLRVRFGNPARRLYERLGFQEVGQDAISAAMEWRAT